MTLPCTESGQGNQAGDRAKLHCPSQRHAIYFCSKAFGNQHKLRWHHDSSRDCRFEAIILSPKLQIGNTGGLSICPFSAGTNPSNTNARKVGILYSMASVLALHDVCSMSITWKHKKKIILNWASHGTTTDWIVLQLRRKQKEISRSNFLFNLYHAFSVIKSLLFHAANHSQTQTQWLY